MKNIDRENDNTVTIIPVVRCALDIISDLFELVPQIKSYVDHIAVSESLHFLTSYLSSSDPKTVISAAKFLTNIILYFCDKDVLVESDNIDTDVTLPLDDLKGIYDCAVSMMSHYIYIRDSYDSDTTMSQEQGQSNQTQGRKVLSDCTNTILSKNVQADKVNQKIKASSVSNVEDKMR